MLWGRGAGPSRRGCLGAYTKGRGGLPGAIGVDSRACMARAALPLPPRASCTRNNLPSRFSTAHARRCPSLTPRCALGHLKPGGPKLPSTGKLVARAGPRGPCPRGSCRPPRGHWYKHGLPDPQARPGRPVPVLAWRPSLASRESAGPPSEPAAEHASEPTAEPRPRPTLSTPRRRRRDPRRPPQTKLNEEAR